MQIVRTILWVLLAVVLVLFAMFNATPVEVRIGDILVIETKVAALVIGAFLLGLVPMWLVHRTVRWRLNRRIASLEASVAPKAVAPPEPTPSLLKPQP